MIQRIQTVFLLLASISMSIAAIAPLASVTTGSNVLTLYAFSVHNLQGISTYTVLNGLLALCIYTSASISLLTILLYKKRKLQLFLTALDMIFAFIACNLLVWLAFGVMQSASDSIMFKFSSILPLVALILGFLAYRAIKKDIDLINSLNRLR